MRNDPAVRANGNGHALIAWRPAGFPLEGLLFCLAFGLYWSSVVEHRSWRQRDVIVAGAVVGNTEMAR